MVVKWMRSAGSGTRGGTCCQPGEKREELRTPIVLMQSVHCHPRGSRYAWDGRDATPGL